MSDGKYFYRDAKTGEKIEVTKEVFMMLDRLERAAEKAIEKEKEERK